MPPSPCWLRLRPQLALATARRKPSCHCWERLTGTATWACTCSGGGGRGARSPPSAPPPPSHRPRRRGRLPTPPGTRSCTRSGATPRSHNLKLRPPQSETRLGGLRAGSRMWIAGVPWRPGRGRRHTWAATCTTSSKMVLLSVTVRLAPAPCLYISGWRVASPSWSCAAAHCTCELCFFKRPATALRPPSVLLRSAMADLMASLATGSST